VLARSDSPGCATCLERFFHQFIVYYNICPHGDISLIRYTHNIESEMIDECCQAMREAIARSHLQRCSFG